MTKINTVSICPQCNASMAGTRVCNKCGYKLDKPTSLLFGSPDYLTSQLREQEKGGQTQGLREEFRNWLLVSPYEDKIDALFDAFEIMRVLALTDLPPEQFKMLVKLGIRIGKISTSLEEYIKNGGTTHGLSKTAEPANIKSRDEDFGGTGDIDSY